MYRNHLLSLFLFIWLTSCIQDVSLKEISLKFDYSQEIFIDTANVIELETSDNSLLYDIGQIEMIDNKYFVFSRNCVYVFDVQGNHLFNLSQKGEAPHEYLSLHNLFYDGENICIYDFTAARILKFDTQGKYLSDVKIIRGIDQPNPARIFYLDENTFLTYNSYAGDAVKIPVFSMWNNKMNKQTEMGGRTLMTGMRLSDGCYINEDKRVLYWEPAKDTLFSIIDNVLQPVYRIDFGKYAIPSEIAAKDDYERIMFLNKKENSHYASVARYYQTKDNILYFSCIYNGTVYLCSYDEMTGDTKTYSFTDVGNRYKALPFFKILGDYIILELKDNMDVEKNHALYKFSLKELDEKNN